MIKTSVVIIVLDQIIEEIITGHRKHLKVLMWHREKKRIGIYCIQTTGLGLLEN